MDIKLKNRALDAVSVPIWGERIVELLEFMERHGGSSLTAEMLLISAIKSAEKHRKEMANPKTYFGGDHGTDN